MSDKTALSGFLVVSRGQWEAELSSETIQYAIDRFYVWHERLVGKGRMRAGQRLAPASRPVSKHVVTDSPFAEANELIGGYWHILASSLDEAAQVSAQNPCLACGLTCQIRPIEAQRASAFVASNETPQAR